MKIVSIKQLHETTGRCVREARTGVLVITDRGERVALLKAYDQTSVPGRCFPKRDVRSLPDVGVDSTPLISQDRDER